MGTPVFVSRGRMPFVPSALVQMRVCAICPPSRLFSSSGRIPGVFYTTNVVTVMISKALDPPRLTLAPFRRF